MLFAHHSDSLSFGTWFGIPFRQAKLLVRNLRWLESLNSEVLELQTKLTHVCKEHVTHVTLLC